MKEIRDRFDSIICLCAEGVEFLSRTELAEAVIREAHAGMKLCDSTAKRPATRLEKQRLGQLNYK